MTNREEVQAALDKLTNTPIYAYCQELREENRRLRRAAGLCISDAQRYLRAPLDVKYVQLLAAVKEMDAALEGKP